jgi:outer membrane protein assembly factor BamA
MAKKLFLSWLCASACAFASTAAAQTPQSAADAGSSSAVDRMLARVDTKLEDASEANGFYPEFGGFINGAGLSIGPGYRHRLFGDRAVVDASAAVSYRRYVMMQSRLEWPRLLNDHLAVGGQVKYQDFPQINFFGVGPDSRQANQTDYRLQSLDVAAYATVRPVTWLAITGRAGSLRHVDISRGTSSLHPSIGEVFAESSAPALDFTPTYFHTEASVVADTRDVPGYPSSGGRYRVSFANYSDRDMGRFSFRRLEADAAQYVSIFSPRSVLAARARVDLSGTDAGQTVAFYMLPTLGGPRSLRGYDDYRFRDRNLLLFNGEYRFPILRALDGAAFYDAGTVAPTANALSVHRLMTDYGVGVRVHSKKHMLMRVDVARGSEGTRLVVAFSAPFGSSSQSVVPYLP